MPVDTATKRRQAIQVRLWFLRRPLVAPDGTIDLEDRQSLARSYGGIPPAAIVLRDWSWEAGPPMHVASTAGALMSRWSAGAVRHLVSED